MQVGTHRAPDSFQDPGARQPPTSLHRAQVVPGPPYLFPSEAPPLAQSNEQQRAFPRDGVALKPQALGRNEGSRHALGPIPHSRQMEGWGHF